MADNFVNDDTNATVTDSNLPGGKEPATKHDVTEGGVIGAVGGAIVGGLAGGPLGAIIGAVVGGAASAGAVDVVDKHDHDYNRTISASHTDAMDDDATVNDHLRHSSFQTSATGARTVDGEVVVPVVEEELQVGKRQVESGGARIHTNVIETPVSESVNLHEEHITVDRHSVDRPLTDADTAFQDRTLEVTETNEVPVVAKTARVVEEVVVGKTAADRTQTVSDSVRRTDVEVETLTGDATQPTVR